MKKSFSRWRTAIISSGIVFQLFFVAELILLYDFIIVNPADHLISYENWVWLINEWTHPVYWDSYFNEILLFNMVINWVFKLLFDIFLIYMIIHPERVSLRRRTIVLTFVLLVIADLCIKYFIKYNVDFYRLYMRSIYTEMLALYMLYCGRRLRPAE